MKYHSKKNQSGFIALMGAIIISTILLGLSLSVSTHEFAARFDSLDQELKRVGLGLAESCSNIALLRIAENYSYSPGITGDILSVGGNSCTIMSVAYGAEDVTIHSKTAVITTRAEYHGTWSEVELDARIHNPAFPLQDLSSPEIIINSWKDF